MAVTISHSGYMKRTPISTYRQQRRGGTGRKGMSTREEDFVEHLFVASTHDYILVFTNTGRVYWLKVYEIPELSAAGKGKAIASLVSLQPGESVRTLMPVRDLEEEGKHIFFVTRQGTVKKTPLKDFSNVMSRGIIAIGIDKGDELVAAAAPTATRSSSWPRTRAWRSASAKRTSVPWDARRTACAAWTSTRATTSSAWRSRRKERKKAQRQRGRRAQPDPVGHREGLRQAHRR